jgi:hypothetical protein
MIAAEGTRKTFQTGTAIIVGASFILAPLDAFFSYRATAPSGQWYAVILETVSIWFLLLGGGGTALLSNPDGGKPPTLIIGAAIFIESVRAVLLSQLPLPGQTIAHETALTLVIVSCVCASLTAVATMLLAAAVGSSLDDGRAKEWEVDHPLVAKFLARVAAPVQWLQRRRVTALYCAFASFLLVAYFLTMAVEFDDRDDQIGRALYVAAPIAAAASDAQSASIQSGPTKLVLTRKTPEPQQPPTHDHVKLFFVSGDAGLESTIAAWPAASSADEKARSDAERLRVQLCAHPSDNGMAKYMESRSSVAALTESEQHIVEQNLLALCAAREWFAADATKGARQRILIFGHSNTAKFDAEKTTRRRSGERPPYLSNAELASARAQQVYLAINLLATQVEQARKERVCDLIRWEVGSGSSEGGMLNPESDAGLAAHLDRQVSVEVQRESTQSTDGNIEFSWAIERDKSSRTLDLLDYTYFMFYTITTTGYGDLMPITPTMKFIVTLANLFEVMYLPIIFAVIIWSRQRTQEETQNGKGKTATEIAAETEIK